MGRPPGERAAAMAKGEITYFTGKACSRGHIVPHYTKSGACMFCDAEYPRSAVAKARAKMERLIAPMALAVALAVSGPALAYNDFDALADAAWGLSGEGSNSAGHAQYIGFADDDAAAAAMAGSVGWELIQAIGSCNGQAGVAYDWLNTGWGNLSAAADAGPADFDDPDQFWSWYVDANWILSEVQWYVDNYIAGC